MRNRKAEQRRIVGHGRSCAGSEMRIGIALFSPPAARTAASRVDSAGTVYFNRAVHRLVGFECRGVCVGDRRMRPDALQRQALRVSSRPANGSTPCRIPPTADARYDGVLITLASSHKPAHRAIASFKLESVSRRPGIVDGGHQWMRLAAARNCALGMIRLEGARGLRRICARSRAPPGTRFQVVSTPSKASFDGRFAAQGTR